ncbi:MAG: response regulator [Myxococcota bacterium]
MSTVLFAHERPSVRRAVGHVLGARGFTTQTVASGDAAASALRDGPVDAFVVDVALPGRPAYELIDVARESREQGRGARVVVLVASVFRKTSYKRRPARLYGADDYVELHHLGDMLPEKLAKHLSLPEPAAAPEAVDAATRAVCVEADTRFEEQTPAQLAALIVADMVLYNGDRIAETATLADARTALRDDLDIARDLLGQVFDGVDPIAPIEDAFDRLMSTLGRTEVAS